MDHPSSLTEMQIEVWRRDRDGQRFHLACAMLFLCMMAVSTALSGISFAILLVVSIIRYGRIAFYYKPLWRIKGLWLMPLWLIWCLLTLFWSSDPGQGLDELGAARHLLLPLMLWPLLGERNRLIAALLVGIFFQNMVQLAQALDLSDLMKHGAGDRAGGWLHPIQTGVFCGAALCWYLATLIHERSPKRWLVLIPALAAFFGLIVSGSRGPWLACFIVLPLQFVFLLIRLPERRRFIIQLALASLIIGALGGWLGRSMIQPRLEQAKTEYIQAIENGDYGTSVGLRIGLWTWAWDSFRERPILGHGLGSYRNQILKQPTYQIAAERWPRKAENYMQRDHAHSIYLHLLACAGIVGATLFVIFLIWSLVAAWRMPRSQALNEGVLSILLLWMLTAQFDALHLIGHMFGLLMFLISLTLAATDQSDPPAKTSHQ
ncbi:MAG: O-antigen ligase family protein [Planctomycetota bacterium]|nr:O-antigen ligase family protein [Planctomycetota bacterium]